MDPIPPITVKGLMARYDALLLDAYGVLIHQEAALPGAPEWIARLNREGKPYFILTNDASRLPETTAERYRSMGLTIPVERIITAGSLLVPAFADQGLKGARCMVLGPEDTVSYVEQAGGVVVPVSQDGDLDVVVVGDERGYPFLETVDAVITALLRHLDAGRTVHLILANPDLIFLRGKDSYGITAGSIALVLEAALALRYPSRPTFQALGKPHSPIFAEAARRSGTRNMVMVGDQMETDILGARSFGIDSALVTTGLTRLEAIGETMPTWVLESLAS